MYTGAMVIRHFAARLLLILAVALPFAESVFAHPRWRAVPYRYAFEEDRRPSARDLRGTVESVDRDRNTFVIHSDATGAFITVARRDRRVDPRPGDFVSISGPWNRRTGRLEGYSIRLLE